MASFLRTTCPMNTTVSPSLSASMRSAVITMGSRAPVFRSEAWAETAATNTSSRTPVLFLKNRLDIALHRHFLHVHIGIEACAFEINILAQNLERVLCSDQPFARFPGQGVRRHQISLARHDPHVPAVAPDRCIAAYRVHGAQIADERRVLPVHGRKNDLNVLER